MKIKGVIEDLKINKKNDHKNSKNISGSSLMLWAVWGHFQGGSLSLTSSVCCFFRLTSSVTLWGGGMLQTNSTVMCTQCLSPAGPVPSRGAQTAQVL